MKKSKPTTPGIRHRIKFTTPKVDLSDHLKGSAKSTGGRSFGRLTVRGRGGGAKHMRLLVTDGALLDLPSLNVSRILTDSRRSAPLIECFYINSQNRISNTLLLTHILGVKPGDVLKSNVVIPKASVTPGNLFYIKDVPRGTSVCLISWGKRPSLVRSAGTFATLVKKENKLLNELAVVKIKDRIVKIPIGSHCTIGRIAGLSHKKEVLGKAGAKRLLGRRPKVRGVAINPVDHPMGGGEGKTSGGVPKSPWGKLISK